MIKIVKLHLVYLLLLCFLLPSIKSFSQVQTARYVAMTNKVNGFYEYLPKGYDSGTGTYPLIIFLCGIAELGDGSPSQLPWVLRNGIPNLINAGTFPQSFTVNGQTTGFIVITPQFTPSPLPNATNVDDVLNYVMSHYRVNPNKVYLTGLSFGGGLVWAYAGNPLYANKVAAVLPVASATNTDSIYNRSRVIANANTPVWATHNRSDSSAPITYVNEYINGINQAPAPNPKARLTAFYSASHDAWTRTYDPNYREDGINVYEWMLQYTLGVAHPVTPPDYNKYVRVNLYGGVNPISGTQWNNWNVPTASYLSSGTLKWQDGTSSGISAVLTNSKGIVDNGATYGSGMAPDTVTRYGSYSNTQRMLTISGLSPTKKYNLELYSSSKTSGYSTIFVVNGSTDTVNSYNNYLDKSSFLNLTPTAAGQLTVGIKTIGTYNYLNGFTLSTDSTSGTPPPAPVDSSNFVRVNLYGGTNPTADPKWNNWNTGTASVSNSNSGVLKFSNGTSSGISAVLSTSAGLTDNGAGYGGGMAPDTVIRYGSYASAQRTLTISGLQASKTYNLEFYSSKSAAGYPTVFTINSKSDTVVSSYNLIDKAPFTSVTPTASGQIVVTLKGLNSYNYLNGFMIWPDTSSGTVVTPPPATDSSKFIRVNLFGGTNPIADTRWNNWSTGTTSISNAGSGTLKYSDGTSSGVAAVLSVTQGLTDNGTGYGSGMAPAEVIRYGSYANVQRTLTISGLATDKTYRLEFYSSKKAAGYSSVFTIGSTADTVLSSFNLTQKAEFAAISPNASGQIVVTVKGLNAYNYINGFMLWADTAKPVTAPPAPDSSKYVRVNVYGGTNPYTNAKWNNWNTGTSAISNSSSGILKNSDGTASTISAVLSISKGLTDNSTGYGSGMAPDTVLRYGSYSDVVRTLTFSGLSTSQTYNLDFYSSKKASTYYTVFTINGVSDTVLSSFNLTQVAPFRNIAPNSSGQIVVTIKGTNTYNYLNGFMIWASAAPSATTRAAESRGVLSADDHNGVAEVYPNPVRNSFRLQLAGTYKGSVQVRVFNSSGSLVKAWQVNKNLDKTQHNLSAAGLTPGYYIIQVQMGSRKESIGIMKQD